MNQLGNQLIKLGILIMILGFFILCGILLLASSGIIK